MRKENILKIWIKVLAASLFGWFYDISNFAGLFKAEDNENTMVYCYKIQKRKL